MVKLIQLPIILLQFIEFEPAWLIRLLVGFLCHELCLFEYYMFSRQENLYEGNRAENTSFLFIYIVMYSLLLRTGSISM